MPLPVESILPDLLESLSSQDVLLSAPPGAGKSTAIPMALLQSTNRKMVLLQPRRVVVKQLAQFLASQLGEKVGETVGFRIRGEQAVSAKTRLEIITEGILTRRIQQDPELEGVDILLFDEFHERSLHSDFGLALAIEVQQNLREDLRLLVMSATLDVSPLKKLLPTARILSSEGRRFPVEEVYVGNCSNDEIVKVVTQQVRTAVSQQEGDILVFLPTVKTIRLAEQALNGMTDSQTVVLPLHGGLTLGEQQRAVQPLADNKRKVILATNIAETSLTIEGISVVIDSGREQVAQYHPGTRMTELSLKMISQASAEQRKGRAGRLSSGICYRLWSQEAQSRLAEFSLPAIRREDISGIALHTAAWGTNLNELPLLEAPTEAQCSVAAQQLRFLSLTSTEGRITSLGKEALKLPVQPQYASMLLRLRDEAELSGSNSLLLAGCLVAALAEESPKAQSWRVSEVIHSLPQAVKNNLVRQAGRYAGLLGLTAKSHEVLGVSSEQIALAIALAQPAWLAKAKSTTEYKLAMGTGAVLTEANFNEDPWLAVLSGQRKDARMLIRLAEPINEDMIYSYFSEHFQSSKRAYYDESADSVRAEQQHCFQNIQLAKKPLNKPNEALCAACWSDWLSGKAIQDWLFFNEIDNTLNRLAMAQALDIPVSVVDENSQWPAIDNQWLLASESFQTALGKARSLAQLHKTNWSEAILQALPWYQKQSLDSHLPGSIVVPSGSRRQLRYESATRVVLSVKMQEMYGSNKPLSVAGGRQAVTVELLSPAGRPIQTTNDLPRFWQGSYSEVRKDMKGRYPKHFWPEDPTTAIPSSKTTKNK